MPLTNFAEVQPIVAAQVWLPGDGTAFKTILASQPTICRLDTLIAVNDDSTTHSVTVTLIDPTSTIHGIGSVIVPSLAGHGSVPAFDIFANLFPSTQVGLAFPAGWVLEAAMAVATTSALGIVGYGGYF